MFWTLYLVYPCISSYFLYHVPISKNSYHFTTCFINWPYVWLHICMVHHSWGRDSVHQVYSMCFPMFLSFWAGITARWVERKCITGRNKTVKSNISFFPLPWWILKPYSRWSNGTVVGTRSIYHPEPLSKMEQSPSPTHVRYIKWIRNNCRAKTYTRVGR